jgi:hypothetical protein
MSIHVRRRASDQRVHRATMRASGKNTYTESEQQSNAREEHEYELETRVKKRWRVVQD